MAWPRVKVHLIIVVANTTLQIACILVTRPRSRSPRSAQLVGAVVDAVGGAKVTKISGTKEMIIRMGIEMIM